MNTAKIKTIAPDIDSKGTVVVLTRGGVVFEEMPATVVRYWAGTASSRPVLLVQLDGVDPDHKTYSRNVLGRELFFTLTQKRRWISPGERYSGNDWRGGMHFVPGPQAYQPPPF